MTKDSVKNLKNIHNRASKKNIIATFALDILMATADTYVAVSQLLEVRVQLAGQRVSFRAVLVRHKSDFLHHISDKCKHPIKDDYPGCWGVATFASNTKSHDDKGRGRPGDCLLRREQDQLQTAPV